MSASETRIVQVDDHRLFVIAARSPAALAGRMAGAADTREQFSSLGFTHGDPFTGDSPALQLGSSRNYGDGAFNSRPVLVIHCLLLWIGNGRILAAIEYWEMAHPTRFERVAFAFGAI
jgi:hypothetical protein